MGANVTISEERTEDCLSTERISTSRSRIRDLNSEVAKQKSKKSKKVKKAKS